MSDTTMRPVDEQAVQAAMKTVLIQVVCVAIGIGMTLAAITATWQPSIVGAVIGLAAGCIGFGMWRIRSVTPSVLPSWSLHVLVVLYLLLSHAGLCQSSCGALADYEQIAGVSTTLLGMIGHACAAGLILWAAKPQAPSWASLLAHIISWSLVGVSAVFSAILIHERSFCGSCIASHALMLIQAVLMIRSLGRSGWDASGIMARIMACGLGAAAVHVALSLSMPKPLVGDPKAMADSMTRELGGNPTLSVNPSLAQLYALGQKAEAEQAALAKQPVPDAKTPLTSSADFERARKIMAAQVYRLGTVSPEEIEWAKQYYERLESSAAHQQPNIHDDLPDRKLIVATEAAINSLDAPDATRAAGTVVTPNTKVTTTAPTPTVMGGRTVLTAGVWGQDSAPSIMTVLYDPHCPACAKQTEVYAGLSDLVTAGKLQIKFHVVYPTRERNRVSAEDERTFQAAATVIVATGFMGEEPMLQTMLSLARNQRSLGNPGDVLRYIPDGVDRTAVLDIIKSRQADIQTLLGDARNAQIARNVRATPAMWMNQRHSRTPPRQLEGFQSDAVLRLAIQSLMP